MKVMYPGSFDPITIGHIDLIERSARMFEGVVVAIMANDSKNYLFDEGERIALIKGSVKHLDNVEVVVGEGLTVDFAKKMGCSVLIRGIRAVMDYEYELQQATANRCLNGEIETVFLVASPEYSFISSSLARTVASYQGDLKPFVPVHVIEALQKVYAKNR